MVKRAREVSPEWHLAKSLRCREYPQVVYFQPIDAEGQSEAAGLRILPAPEHRVWLGALEHHAEKSDTRYNHRLEIDELCADFTTFVRAGAWMERRQTSYRLSG